MSDEEVDAIFEAMLDDANDDQRTEILSWGNGSADLSTLREEAQRLAVELSKTARHDPDDAEHKTARELAKAWGKSDDGRVDLAATSLITEPPPAAELSAEQVPDDDTERAEARALAKKWKEHE